MRLLHSTAAVLAAAALASTAALAAEKLDDQQPKAIDGIETVCDGITIADRKTGTSEEVAARYVFVFIGAAPRTEWLRGTVALDRQGFVLTGPDQVCRGAAAHDQPDGIDDDRLAGTGFAGQHGQAGPE